jgi:hypothetical protein
MWQELKNSYRNRSWEIKRIFVIKITNVCLCIVDIINTGKDRCLVQRLKDMYENYEP